MKEYWKLILPWVLTGILFTLLVIQWFHKRQADQYVSGVDTVTVVEFVRDTVFKEVEVDRPVPYKVIERDTVYEEKRGIDYFQAFKECCLTSNFYSDTIRDEVLEAIVEEEVYMNSIVSRNFDYRLLSYPTREITKTVVEREKGLFVGPVVGTSFDNFGAGVSLMYLNGKGHAYDFKYDIIQQNIYMGYHWKFDLRLPWQ